MTLQVVQLAVKYIKDNPDQFVNPQYDERMEEYKKRVEEGEKEEENKIDEEKEGDNNFEFQAPHKVQRINRYFYHLPISFILIFSSQHRGILINFGEARGTTPDVSNKQRNDGIIEMKL